MLRLIVYRLIKIYEQSVNPKRSAYSNQYTFKVKHGENLVDSEESSNDVSQSSRPGAQGSGENDTKHHKKKKSNNFPINPIIDFDTDNEGAGSSHTNDKSKKQ